MLIMAENKKDGQGGGKKCDSDLILRLGVAAFWLDIVPQGQS